MAESRHSLIASQNWSEIGRRLTLFVSRRLGRRGSLQDAEEIAQEAICRFLDPDYADWDQDREPELLHHLGSVANGVMRNRLQRKAVRLERPYDPVREVPAPVAHEGDRLEARDETRRALELLRGRLDGDGVANAVLDLIVNGLDKAAEQALRLGLPVSEVYKARKRLVAHRAAVRRTMEGEASDV